MVKILACLLLVVSSLSAEPLRIVSYNLHHGEGMDGKLDLERLARIIAKEKPDLVALQEVDQKCKRSGNVEQAAELGRLLKMNHAFGKFMDYQGGEYGMAVLSRFPIEKVTRHVLPSGAEPRCALEVQIKPEGWTEHLSFVGIHLDWTEGGFRLKQVSRLVDLKGAVILAGDFNAEPGSPTLEILKKAGWETLRKKSVKTCPADKPTHEIDFFIVRGLPEFTYTERVIDERVASDHRPISAAISFSKK
ncbi:endonuclease/exonuclease/phosphatase family protein [Akkermansiaceae bacterium]|nr:endonuclease/exonuclease/phosphatase family protein [Akkermansiaceae bacterium]